MESGKSKKMQFHIKNFVDLLASQFRRDLPATVRVQEVMSKKIFSHFLTGIKNPTSKGGRYSEQILQIKFIPDY